MGLYGPSALIAVTADAIWQWLNRPPSTRTWVVMIIIAYAAAALLDLGILP
jgi:hypothetical protein